MSMSGEVMVKGFLVIVALLGLAAYYVISHHSPFQTAVTDPHYVKIRVEITLPKANIQLVGIGKMNSYEDCQARALLFWADNLAHLGQAKIDAECKKDIPNKYLKLFDNKQSTATYIAFDKGNDGERDGRFLIYGVPSSLAHEACEKLVEESEGANYSGKIYCVRGSVG